MTTNVWRGQDQERERAQGSSSRVRSCQQTTSRHPHDCTAAPGLSKAGLQREPVATTTTWSRATHDPGRPVQLRRYPVGYFPRRLVDVGRPSQFPYTARLRYWSKWQVSRWVARSSQSPLDSGLDSRPSGGSKLQDTRDKLSRPIPIAISEDPVPSRQARAQHGQLWGKAFASKRNTTVHRRLSSRLPLAHFLFFLFLFCTLPPLFPPVILVGTFYFLGFLFLFFNSVLFGPFTTPRSLTDWSRDRGGPSPTPISIVTLTRDHEDEQAGAAQARVPPGV
jgi:hypothetical protein